MVLSAGQGPTTATAYGALLTLGLVQTAFAGVLFLSGLRRVRTDHAAILTYAEPVSAVAFAAAVPRANRSQAGRWPAGRWSWRAGVVVARLTPKGGALETGAA